MKLRGAAKHDSVAAEPFSGAAVVCVSGVGGAWCSEPTRTEGTTQIRRAFLLLVLAHWDWRRLGNVPVFALKPAGAPELCAACADAILLKHAEVAQW